MSQPPDFEKKPNCYKCGVGFGLITRQHHCRNCGKSVCDKCSSKNLPLPHFNINESVRVCEQCYSSLTAPKPKAVEPAPSPSSSSSSSNNNLASSSSSASEVKSKRVAVCKCGLPVCICPPDKEEKAAAPAPVTSSKPASSSSSSSSSSGKTTSSFVPSGGFGFGQFSSASKARTWDLKGNLDEQCREAIKYGDDTGALLLLKTGANPKFIDHTGNSLLHLAAMFDRSDIVKDLLARGADAKVKNASGETPIDVAPIALQHRIREIVAAAKA